MGRSTPVSKCSVAWSKVLPSEHWPNLSCSRVLRSESFKCQNISLSPRYLHIYIYLPDSKRTRCQRRVLWLIMGQAITFITYDAWVACPSTKNVFRSLHSELTHEQHRVCLKRSPTVCPVSSRLSATRAGHSHNSLHSRSRHLHGLLVGRFVSDLPQRNTIKFAVCNLVRGLGIRGLIDCVDRGGEECS